MRNEQSQRFVLNSVQICEKWTVKGQLKMIFIENIYNDFYRPIVHVSQFQSMSINVNFSQFNKLYCECFIFPHYGILYGIYGILSQYEILVIGIGKSRD